MSTAAEPWFKGRKLDQWICFWIVPFFYTLFGLVFVPLSWFFPPQSPTASFPEIVAFLQHPNILIAGIILMLTIGLSGVCNAIYVTQIWRMSVSPVFRYAFMMGATTGAIVGCLFPFVCFTIGTFREGYDPQIMQLLYDFGYMSFIGCLGCFFVMWTCMGLAIILDDNNTLPKWLGYYTVWQAMTELFATTLWVAQVGPFAWDGLLAFWFNMVLYVPWQIIVYVVIFNAMRNQTASDAGGAQMTPHASYA